jgi:hypothetical protein
MIINTVFVVILRFVWSAVLLSTMARPIVIMVPVQAEWVLHPRVWNRRSKALIVIHLKEGQVRLFLHLLILWHIVVLLSSYYKEI